METMGDVFTQGREPIVFDMLTLFIMLMAVVVDELVVTDPDTKFPRPLVATGPEKSPVEIARESSLLSTELEKPEARPVNNRSVTKMNGSTEDD
jgi:hypothetical protein